MNTRPLTKGMVAILGGNGLLGSDLAAFLGDFFNVVPIDRSNYAAHRGEEFDVLINANGNSKRFWANEHPLEDFDASTVSAARSLFDFGYKKYIYISTPDVYENPTNTRTTLEDMPGMASLAPYGFHKRLSECLVERYAEDYLILRSSALLGTKLKKGVVYDILRGNELFVTLDSVIQFVTTRALADAMLSLIRNNVRREVFNIGGKGGVTPETVAGIFGKPAHARGDAESQRYEMNIQKISEIYPDLKTSEEYVRLFAQARAA